MKSYVWYYIPCLGNKAMNTLGVNSDLWPSPGSAPGQLFLPWSLFSHQFWWFSAWCSASQFYYQKLGPIHYMVFKHWKYEVGLSPTLYMVFNHLVLRTRAQSHYFWLSPIFGGSQPWFSEPGDWIPHTGKDQNFYSSFVRLRTGLSAQGSARGLNWFPGEVTA